MWYGSKSLLESIVRWLKPESAHDDAEWQAQTELLQSCHAEMVETLKNSATPAQSLSRYVHRPGADRLKRALLHIHSMLEAMERHDRIAAIEHGEATLGRL